MAMLTGGRNIHFVQLEQALDDKALEFLKCTLVLPRREVAKRLQVFRR